MLLESQCRVAAATRNSRISKSKFPENIAAAESETLERVGTLVSHEGLLRAAKLTTVLGGAGQLFKDSNGNASTYELSKPVEHMQAFFSHNWTVRRSFKYLCLALHFNTGMALCVSSACLLVCCVLTARGFFPSVASEDTLATGMAGTIFTPPLALLTLLFGHNLRWLGRDPMIFLDKCCIHQSDTQLKKKGISKLSAFLFRSSTLVICYTEVYLKKLWTVYELASFLAIHPDPASRLRLVPAQLAPVVICIMLLGWVMMSMYSVGTYLFPHFPHIAVQGATVAPSILGLVRVLRAWAREQDNMYRNVHSFNMSDASCFCEEDRHMVEGNVLDLMKGYRLVDVDSTRQQTLDAFNRLVRQELPVALVKSIGRVGVCFHHYQLLSLPFTCAYFDNWAAQYHFGFRDTQSAVLWFIRCTMIPLVVLPLVFAVAAKASNCCLHLKGCCEIAFWAILGTIVLSGMLVSNISSIIPQMSSTMDVSPIISTTYVGSYVICLVVLRLVFKSSARTNGGHKMRSDIIDYKTKAGQVGVSEICEHGRTSDCRALQSVGEDGLPVHESPPCLTTLKYNQSFQDQSNSDCILQAMSDDPRFCENRESFAKSADASSMLHENCLLGHSAVLPIHDRLDSLEEGTLTTLAHNDIEELVQPHVARVPSDTFCLSKQSQRCGNQDIQPKFSVFDL